MNSIVVCPKCNGSLYRRLNEYTCNKCAAKYPILNGDLPILSSSAFIELGKSYLRLKGAFLNEEITVPKALASRLCDSKSLLKLAKRANEGNSQILNDIIGKIDRVVTPAILTQILLDPDATRKDSGYGLNFNYLRRDWCHTLEGEEEIGVTIYQLKELAKLGSDFRSSLFIGAGMARIAYEMTSQFKLVYAIDSSIEMGLLFKHIRKADLRFYEILKSNLQSKKDIINGYRASTRFANPRQMRRLKCLIGDALQMPFKNKSFSAIFSVYFTDVVPLPSLMSELKRILKPAGVFIHFGPLEYHSKDWNVMFSLEEIFALFKQNDFEILQSGKVNSTHCQSARNGARKVFTNWFFVAQKKVPLKAISQDDIFSIKGTIEYVQNGILANRGSTVHLMLRFKNGETLKTTEAIFEILKSINGERNFREVIHNLERFYGKISKKQKEAILNTLITLVSKNLISVTRG